MKSLEINYKSVDDSLSLDKFNDVFSLLKSWEINEVNWENSPYKPKVSFKLFYSNSYIYIKYNIFEKSVLARKQSTNDPVYKDSCVEFFVNPGDGNYYNFEFNAIGTSYGGSSPIGGEGKTIESEQIDRIDTYSTLGKNPFEEREGDTSWSLIVKIPLDLFTNIKAPELKGVVMRANFYKCGDEMKEPHFVSWNKIKNKTPNFHLPEYFGEIRFN